MSQCKTGDKPIITYTFGSNPNKQYQASVAPIDITTKTVPIDATSNYNPAGYQITFNSPQAQYLVVTTTVIDYQIFYNPGDGYYIAIIPCGQTSYPRMSPSKGFPYDANGIALSLALIGSSITSVNNNIHCSGTKLNRCSIQVSSNGQLLFQDQGDCPVTYSVQCGNCPDGTCECAAPIYPGYCCNDCASTGAQIQAISNQLREKINASQLGASTV